VPATGVDGAVVRLLDGGCFTAWASTTDRDTLPRERPAIEQIVRAHDGVVAAAVAAGITVIPSPVTTPYTDDTACIIAIGNRITEIGELARRVEGRVEMALLLTTSSSTPRQEGRAFQGAGPGRRYLEGTRESGAASVDDGAIEASVIALRAAVGTFVLAESRRDLGANDQGSDRSVRSSAVSHLIARVAVASYREAAGSTKLPETVDLVIDGPRAAYSFAAFAPSGTILAG
jgi:hypothetical protein